MSVVRLLGGLIFTALLWQIYAFSEAVVAQRSVVILGVVASFAIAARTRP